MSENEEDERRHNRWQAERALGRELVKMLSQYELTPLELIEITAKQVARLIEAERRDDEKE